MRDVEATAVAFGEACDAVDVKYALIGALAVSAWGQPRATSDVDALVVLAPERVHALAHALRERRLTVDARDFESAFSDRTHVTVFDEESPFHVDVKLARTPEEREQVARAARVVLDGRPLSVAAAEETVAFKLHYGTPKDVQDAESILVRMAGRLDLARLRSVADRLGVRVTLEAMLPGNEGPG